MRRTTLVLCGVFAVLTLAAAPAGAHHGKGSHKKPTPPPPTSQPVKPAPVGSAPSSAYDALVWNDGAQLLVTPTGDATNRGHAVSFSGGTLEPMPNGDATIVYDGQNDYTQVADANDLSVTNTGILTLEAWVRPDTLDHPSYEAEGYVHWLGKGVSGQHEYVARTYNKASDRPNRISGYAYNLTGGQGAGSYFQDSLSAGQWIHYGLVIDNFNKDSQGYGTVRIYKNGVLRDTDTMGGSYHIKPGNGSAPLRIGTRDFGSYFQGAIGKVAVYNYDASGTFASHVNAMK